MKKLINNFFWVIKVNCETCGKEIKDTDKVVQVRIGALDKNDDFVPDSDLCYQHQVCYDHEINIVYNE